MRSGRFVEACPSVVGSVAPGIYVFGFVAMSE